jgi:hypothetical protein
VCVCACILNLSASTLFAPPKSSEVKTKKAKISAVFVTQLTSHMKKKFSEMKIWELGAIMRHWCCSCNVLWYK